MRTHWQSLTGIGGGIMAFVMPYLDRIEVTFRVIGTVFGGLCAIVMFAGATRTLVRKWMRGED